MRREVKRNSCFLLTVVSITVLLYSFSACTQIDRTRKTVIACDLMTDELMQSVKDSAIKYGYVPYSLQKLNTIQTVKRVDEGVSVRNIYVDITKDSSVKGVSVFVKTVVYFRQTVDTIYYDETVKRVPDYRSDFVPFLNSLRTLCGEEIPNPDYIKKRQVVPWKR